MKKLSLILPFALALFALGSCSSERDEKTIFVAASEKPHAEILNNAVKPLLKKQGYSLEVTILDWTLQNDAVKNLDYDANYFQHRPYLEQYDSGNADYSESYVYKTVFPVVAVHFEPLRIYPGKKEASEFEASKRTATYEICNDTSNAIRALDLLVDAGVIDSYETDSSGNPTNLPNNITLIAEDLLAASISDYDYAILPTNTALTANIAADSSLPSESDDVADLRANVLAANVSEYKNNETYKNKIDVLSDALLSVTVKEYIESEYQGVVQSIQKDLR